MRETGTECCGVCTPSLPPPASRTCPRSDSIPSPGSSSATKPNTASATAPLISHTQLRTQLLTTSLRVTAHLPVRTRPQNQHFIKRRRKPAGLLAPGPPLPTSHLQVLWPWTQWPLQQVSSSKCPGEPGPPHPTRGGGVRVGAEVLEHSRGRLCSSLILPSKQAEGRCPRYPSHVAPPRAAPAS